MVFYYFQDFLYLPLPIDYLIYKIKSKTIYVKSTEDSGVDIAKWSAAKCIVGSIELENGDVYAINSGNWYKINNDFANEIQAAYNNLKLSEIEFIDCKKEENEDQYNRALVDSLEGSHLIHTRNIPYGGGSGNVIEPCDVALGKTLIHIKNNGGSSYLSHLFNQATNSCQLLKDPVFRQKFKQKLLDTGITEVIGDNFDASEYTIVLGIIKTFFNSTPLNIYFFITVMCSNGFILT